jgi:hypothetical protein
MTLTGSSVISAKEMSVVAEKPESYRQFERLETLQDSEEIQ